MGNVQFENQYEITKERFEGWNSLAKNRSMKNLKLVVLFGQIGLGIMVISMILAMIFTEEFVLNSALIVSLVLTIVFIPKLPAIMFKSHVKKLAALTGEAKWLRTISFGEKIEINDGSTITIYPYDKIRHVEKDSDCLNLYVEIGSQLRVLYIYNHLFAIGDADDFLAFITEKCVEKESLWTEHELNKRFKKKSRPMAIVLGIVVALTVFLNTMGIMRSMRFTEIRIGDYYYSTELTKLSLPNENLEDSDIEALKYMTNLRYLDLRGNQITSVSVLSELTNLTSLNLRHNQITDVSALKNLSELTYLYILANPVDSAQVDELASLLPNTAIDRIKFVERFPY